jgi:hypothetical protein
MILAFRSLKMVNKSGIWLQRWASSVWYGTSSRWRTVLTTATGISKALKAVIVTRFCWRMSPLLRVVSCTTNLLLATLQKLHWWWQPHWKLAPSASPASDNVDKQSLFTLLHSRVLSKLCASRLASFCIYISFLFFFSPVS